MGPSAHQRINPPKSESIGAILLKLNTFLVAIPGYVVNPDLRITIDLGSNFKLVTTKLGDHGDADLLFLVSIFKEPGLADTDPLDRPFHFHFVAEHISSRLYPVDPHAGPSDTGAYEIPALALIYSHLTARLTLRGEAKVLNETDLALTPISADVFGYSLCGARMRAGG